MSYPDSYLDSARRSRAWSLLHSATDRLNRWLYHPWRWRCYPRVLAGALAAAVLVSVLGGSGSRALIGRMGGDFPAFYGAGRILAQGDWQQLYDWGRQADAQSDLHPFEEGRFLAFAYPPFVALVYWPLSYLPYELAYLLHTALLTLALWAAVQFMRPMLPRVDRWAVEGFCLAFCFMPMFRAITGAQNTSLTVLLLAAAWRARCQNRDAWAGVLLGLMLYKPQFALPLIGLFVLAGHFRVLAGAAASAGTLYALGACVGGVTWPAAWWAQTARFHAVDQAVNAGNSVGWLGVAEAVLGAQSGLALGLGWSLTAVTALGLAWLWWRRISPLSLRLGLTAVGVVLMQPHCMYYDAGLAVLCLAVLADRGGRKAVAPLAALWLFSMSAIAGTTLGFNPVFLALAVVGALAIRALRVSA